MKNITRINGLSYNFACALLEHNHIINETVKLIHDHDKNYTYDITHFFMNGEKVASYEEIKGTLIIIGIANAIVVK